MNRIEILLWMIGIEAARSSTWRFEEGEEEFYLEWFRELHDAYCMTGVGAA